MQMRLFTIWTMVPIFCLFLSINVVSGQQKISKPGEYSGYSAMLYDEIVRSSIYVPGFDGTNLAVDIYRPGKNNQPVNTPYPSILIQTQYQRSAKSFDGDGLENIGINNLVKHGYVVIIVDGRGTGASYGARTEGFPPEQVLDAKAILEWTVAQPWCNGRIGMMGGSYMGQAQYMFASLRDPHLVSITPGAAPINAYDHHYVGGVWEDVTWFSNMLRGLDFKIPVRSVDADQAPSYLLLKKAREEHKGNIYADQMLSPDMFRDSWSDLTQFRPNITLSPLTYADQIKASKVSAYIMGGWYDIFLRDSLGGYKLIGNKMIIGPWDHGQTCYGGGGITAIEYHRWFDYTLKDIDNGIEAEPPVYYYTINAPTGKEWQFARDWPLPNQKLTKYYFAPGPSETVTSINDGSLSMEIQDISVAKDDYTAAKDVSPCDGKYRRAMRNWSGDMTESTDKKGLTYTSPPLDSDLVVTGSPIANLWVTSTASDGYFFIFLEEVDANGVSHYVSDRGIRASLRKTSDQQPWSDLGLPFHRNNQEDYEPLPKDTPVELKFDIYATSYVFRKGNSIRVTLTCSHLPTYKMPDYLKSESTPVVSIYRDINRPSFVILPVIP